MRAFFRYWLLTRPAWPRGIGFGPTVWALGHPGGQGSKVSATFKYACVKCVRKVSVGMCEGVWMGSDSVCVRTWASMSVRASERGRVCVRMCEREGERARVREGKTENLSVREFKIILPKTNLFWEGSGFPCRDRVILNFFTHSVMWCTSSYSSVAVPDSLNKRPTVKYHSTRIFDRSRWNRSEPSHPKCFIAAKRNVIN